MALFVVDKMYLECKVCVNECCGLYRSKSVRNTEVCNVETVQLA